MSQLIKYLLSAEDSAIVIENLGCWKDTGGDRAIQPIEREHDLLKDSYGSRTDAYKKCLKATLSFGYRVFALQDGGWCASAADAEETYKKHGESNACLEDGEGAPVANQVYKITFHGGYKLFLGIKFQTLTLTLTI